MLAGLDQVRVIAANLAPILEAQLHGATIVYTDEGATSKGLSRLYEKHESVNHSSGEYCRGKNGFKRSRPI